MGELIVIGIRAKETLENDLDVEWIDLVLTAKNMGIAVDEVRAFINEHQPLSNDEEYLQFVQKRRALNY